MPRAKGNGATRTMQFNQAEDERLSAAIVLPTLTPKERAQLYKVAWIHVTPSGRVRRINAVEGLKPEERLRAARR